MFVYHQSLHFHFDDGSNFSYLYFDLTFKQMFLTTEGMNKRNGNTKTTKSLLTLITSNFVFCDTEYIYSLVEIKDKRLLQS